MKILFLSFTCEDFGVAMVTNMIIQLQESFRLRRVVFYVEISSVSIKYTEHYIAAWGYEFYVLVLKVSLMSERSNKIRIPVRPCNILYISFSFTMTIPLLRFRKARGL